VVGRPETPAACGRKARRSPQAGRGKGSGGDARRARRSLRPFQAGCRQERRALGTRQRHRQRRIDGRAKGPHEKGIVRVLDLQLGRQVIGAIFIDRAVRVMSPVAEREVVGLVDVLPGVGSCFSRSSEPGTKQDEGEEGDEDPKGHDQLYGGPWAMPREGHRRRLAARAARAESVRRLPGTRHADGSRADDAARCSRAVLGMRATLGRGTSNGPHRKRSTALPIPVSVGKHGRV
jgi:hypothetical protein